MELFLSIAPKKLPLATRIHIGPFFLCTMYRLNTIGSRDEHVQATLFDFETFHRSEAQSTPETIATSPDNDINNTNLSSYHRLWAAEPPDLLEVWSTSLIFSSTTD